MKKHLVTLALLICGLYTIAQSLPQEEKAIKNEVTKTYIEPLYLGGSVETLEARLHEGFEMFVFHHGEFSKRSKKQWIERLKEVRSRPKKNSTKQERTFKFALIDVTGQTAAVKLEIFYDGKLKFTDYLTLYKLEEGWKVLSKFFTMH